VLSRSECALHGNRLLDTDWRGQTLSGRPRFDFDKKIPVSAVEGSTFLLITEVSIYNFSVQTPINTAFPSDA
jgi:hypothetical protein